MQILTLRRRGCQTIYSIPRAIKPPLLQRELPHIFVTSYPCIITSVLFLISPWYILHYKCCGQIVKNIDQKCLQSKIILPNNEKIGILLNDKLTKKGKWIIGQKGKLPENMRSLSSATTDIECANGLLLRRSIWRDQARVRLSWGLQRHRLAGQMHPDESRWPEGSSLFGMGELESEIPCIFSPLW